VDDVYTGLSGAVIRGGMPAPRPAYLNGVAANEWVNIAGTTGADGSPIDPWCDFTINQLTGELLIALAGGHNDSYMTQVSSIILLDDAPAWETPRRRNSVTLAEANYGFPYCDDGVTPSSRHTRYQTHYCPQRNRIILIGSPSLYGPSTSSVESNGFDLDTNEWDPPGTFPSGATTSTYGTAIDDNGNIWARAQRWNQAANTLVSLPTTYANTSAFDTARRQLFTLCKGNGQGFDLVTLGIVAKTIREDLTGWSPITFNASAAYTEFSSQDLDYSGMDYDPVRDRFLFYYGKGASQGVIYVITPNSGTVWDMSILAQGPNSMMPTAPPVGGAGTNGRFKYAAGLDAMVLMPRRDSDIFVMPLS
jgi:hypothetical protein